MNSKNLFKDIFILAIRLLGLYFFYIGLKDLDVPAFMDLTVLKGDNLDDVISTLLPVIFNLAVGWWLFRNKFLARWAYPESSKLSDRFRPLPEPAAPTSTPAQPPSLTDLEVAEEKLAALVGKPKDDRAAKSSG